jgi:hypothetical protein
VGVNDNKIHEKEGFLYSNKKVGRLVEKRKGSRKAVESRNIKWENGRLSMQRMQRC